LTVLRAPFQHFCGDKRVVWQRGLSRAKFHVYRGNISDCGALVTVDLTAPCINIFTTTTTTTTTTTATTTTTTTTTTYRPCKVKNQF